MLRRSVTPKKRRARFISSTQSIVGKKQNQFKMGMEMTSSAKSIQNGNGNDIIRKIN
jgi:hypothetical protein